MMIRQWTQSKRLFGTAAVLTAGLIMCGCPASERGPVKPPPPDEEPTTMPPIEIVEESEELLGVLPETPAEEPTDQHITPEAEPEADLGPPLVDNPDSLTRLEPEKPLWIDLKNGRVVMIGEICQTNTPLEMFACLKGTKEHEAIVAVDVTAYAVHTGLLAIGADAGHPVQFDPEYVPAAGSEIDVTVHFKDKEGNVQTARAQDWMVDTRTNKPMDFPWVFGGSGFWVNSETGEKHYMAKSGDFICVSNFATAMLDLPIKSSQANEALMFMANPKRIPPRGTPVTLVLAVAKKDKPAE